MADAGSWSAGATGRSLRLPLLPYLIMAAIAEGGVDGGWSADQIGARAGTAFGQGLTACMVRYLVAGKLAPVGLLAAGERGSSGLCGAGWPGSVPWGTGRRSRGGCRRCRTAGGGGRWRSGAAVLVCVAATAPIMAETGTGQTGRTRLASASASAPALASARFDADAARVGARAIAPAVPAAVRTQLAAEQGGLASAGRQLLGNKNIQASPSARAALAQGRVDARLLAILSLLPPSCRSGCWPSSARPARTPARRCAEPRSASPRLPPGPLSSACWTLSGASTGRRR